MRTPTHISGGMPLLGPIAPLLGWATSPFGGARLPNDRGVLPMSTTNAALASDQNRDTRRAVGPSCTTSARPRSLVAAKTSDPIAVQPWSQRLRLRFEIASLRNDVPSFVGQVGASVGPAVSCPGTHHKLCGSSLGRSGASPYQPLDHQVLMTKIKTFVPCINPFPVSL